MARRRARRRKYTWFPTNGTEVARGGQTTFIAAPEPFLFSFGPGVDVAHVIQPLILADFPIEDEAATDTLNDIIGNEYVIERIVGNFFATAYLDGTTSSGEYPGAVYMGFGIFVARADGNDPTAAIGSADATGDVEQGSRNYNPLEVQTIREPWMFRRTWVLSTAQAEDTFAGPPYNTNKFTAQTQREAVSKFPKTTAHYTGHDSGHFIDVRSVRRVRQDERLWAVCAAMPYPVGYGGASPTGTWTVRIDGGFDYRILGALRRSKNRSNF